MPAKVSASCLCLTEGLGDSMNSAADVDGAGAPPVGGICRHGHLNGRVAAAGDSGRRRVDKAVVVDHLGGDPTVGAWNADSPIFDAGNPNVVCSRDRSDVS